MKKAIARIGDMTIGEQVECKMPPTAILKGSPNVLINGRAAATIGSNVFTHFCFAGDRLISHTKRIITQGSSTVLINGQAAAHIGSVVDCTDIVVQGSPNVFIGV